MSMENLKKTSPNEDIRLIICNFTENNRVDDKVNVK